MHEATAVQVTPLSPLNCAPAGTGARWMRHRAPSHRSTRSFEFEAPTAVQLSAAGHATAARMLAGDPGGLGVGWMRQRLPSHRSASVSRAPDPAANDPTAVHAEPDGHDTPLRALAAAPAGFGVDWTVHLPPLRRSASVTPRPDSRTCKPTAVHTDAVGHDTVLSAPFPARGFGLGVTDHPAREALAGAANTPIRRTGANSNADLFIAIPSRPQAPPGSCLTLAPQPHKKLTSDGEAPRGRRRWGRLPGCAGYPPARTLLTALR